MRRSDVIRYGSMKETFQLWRRTAPSSDRISTFIMKGTELCLLATGSSSTSRASTGGPMTPGRCTTSHPSLDALGCAAYGLSRVGTVEFAAARHVRLRLSGVTPGYHDSIAIQGTCTTALRAAPHARNETGRLCRPTILNGAYAQQSIQANGSEWVGLCHDGGGLGRRVASLPHCGSTRAQLAMAAKLGSSYHGTSQRNAVL